MAAKWLRILLMCLLLNPAAMLRIVGSALGWVVRLSVLLGGTIGLGGCGVEHATAPHVSMCPAQAPVDGSAYQSEAGACEYGGDRFGRCSLLASCTWDSEARHLTWQLSQQPGCDNAPGCPANFTSLPQHAACPGDLTTACDYPQGHCSCEACFDDETRTTRGSWQCIALALTHDLRVCAWRTQAGSCR